MSKNLQKTLAGALATMSVMSIATPVMATTVDIDALYKNAYDAMRKAQETQTQTDINAAMELIWELRHIGDERKDENLINAACTWSSLVDEVQHPKLVKIVTAITKAQESGRQADINEAFATIEPELPAVWRSSYTSAIDLVQQKLQDELVKAVEKAEADKTEESIKDARELVNEVLTANSEAMVEWAKIFEAKLDNIVGDGTGDDDCLIDQEVADLNITDIEVNRKQIKVTFDALEKSLDDVTLTVLDNNGNEVKVKSVAIIKKGATEAKFEFNNYLSEKPTGVWNVNGVSFNLTEKAFVKDVKDANNAKELGKVLAKEEYKDLVTYNKDRLANYVEELQKAELKEVKDIQSVIDKVNAELDKEKSESEYINLLKKVLRSGSDDQLLNELSSKFQGINKELVNEYRTKLTEELNNKQIKLTQIQEVIDDINKAANAEKINDAKTDLKTALEGSDKKAILEALQNSLLGLDNVKDGNIDHYVLDKDSIKNKLEKHTGLEKVNEYLNMINEKADVVNANTLENMIKALGKFSQTRNFGDFNNLSTVKKQDTAEELLRNISSQEKQYSIGDLEKEIVKINKNIEEKLENLNAALKALKDARKEKKADDLTLPLRNALKEIINKDVEVSEADKFYNNSFDSKGELVEYSNYTDIRTAFNK